MKASTSSMLLNGIATTYSSCTLHFDLIVVHAKPSHVASIDYATLIKLLYKLMHSMEESVDEHLVVVYQVLFADINVGYEDSAYTVLALNVALNGKLVKNLKCLADMVESCKEKYLEFELEYQQVFQTFLEKLV